MEELLSKSRVSNDKTGITGFLIYFERIITDCL